MFVLKLKIILEMYVPHYEKPKRRLEQYRTPPEVAIEIAQLMDKHCSGSIVVDQGSGTGMISYALAFVTKHYIIGLEVDSDAVEAAHHSRLWSIIGNLDFVEADVNYPPIRRVDCIAQNPPFGIHRRGIDKIFLMRALDYNPDFIVSLHHYNSKSVKVLSSTCLERGYKPFLVKRIYFPIQAIYDTHRSKIYYIQVFILACGRYNEETR